jgi:hypothetical protein
LQRWWDLPRFARIVQPQTKHVTLVPLAISEGSAAVQNSEIIDEEYVASLKAEFNAVL